MLNQKIEKPKVKKKPIAKRPQPVAKKSSIAVGAKGDASYKASSAAKTTAVSTASSTNLSKKPKTPVKSNDCKELVVRKRMASLNASAMLAAAYEVERHLDRVESMATSEDEAPKSVLPKKIKDIKDIKGEVLESKDVNTTTQTRSLNIFFLKSKMWFFRFHHFFLCRQSPFRPMWLSFRTPTSPSPASTSIRRSVRARKPIVRCNTVFNPASPRSVWYGRHR